MSRILCVLLTALALAVSPAFASKGSGHGSGSSKSSDGGRDHGKSGHTHDDQCQATTPPVPQPGGGGSGSPQPAPIRVVFGSSTVTSTTRDDPSPLDITPGAGIQREVVVVKVVPVSASVYFRTGSAQLTMDGKKRLREIFAGLVLADQSIELIGLADYRGRRGYNHRLSLDRALATKSFLVSIGAQPDQIQVIALGESRAKQPPARSDELAADRRVDVTSMGPGTVTRLTPDGEVTQLTGVAREALIAELHQKGLLPKSLLRAEWLNSR